MKKIFLFIFFSGFIFSQESETSEYDPCSDPLLILARKDGIKAMPLKDIFKYRKLVKECERYGGEKVIQQIELRDFERDFRKSQTMASWTSTYSICVFIVMIYYFIGSAAATK